MAFRKVYQSIHFKIKEQELWFDSKKQLPYPKCHHIDNLYCSYALSIKANECSTFIQCVLLKNKHMFKPYGILVDELERVDQELRRKK